MIYQPTGGGSERGPAAFGDEPATDEAWAAFEQLLDAAQPDFELAPNAEAAWVDGVRRRLAARRTHAKKRLWAAAATVLACGGAGWFAAGQAPARAPAPEPRQIAAAFAGPAAGDDRTDWNARADWDARGLDLELAWTSQLAANIETQWQCPADRLAYVRGQMDALEAEFDGDSL